MTDHTEIEINRESWLFENGSSVVELHHVGAVFLDKFSNGRVKA